MYINYWNVVPPAINSWNLILQYVDVSIYVSNPWWVSSLAHGDILRSFRAFKGEKKLSENIWHAIWAQYEIIVSEYVKITIPHHSCVPPRRYAIFSTIRMFHHMKMAIYLLKRPFQHSDYYYAQNNEV